MHVQQILKSKADDTVVTIIPGASVREAAELLSARRIGSLVVSLGDSRIAGILSVDHGRHAFQGFHHLIACHHPVHQPVSDVL